MTLTKKEQLAIDSMILCSGKPIVFVKTEFLPEIYYVRKIISHKIIPGRIIQFLTLWENYPDSHSTWENKDSFIVDNKVNSVFLSYIYKHNLKI
jgi:hypothetical protein